MRAIVASIIGQPGGGDPQESHGIFVGRCAMFADMLDAMVTHGIKPVIDREFAFAEAPPALRTHLKSGGHFGKIVIRGRQLSRPLSRWALLFQRQAIVGLATLGMEAIGTGRDSTKQMHQGAPCPRAPFQRPCSQAITPQPRTPHPAGAAGTAPLLTPWSARSRPSWLGQPRMCGRCCSRPASRTATWRVGRTGPAGDGEPPSLSHEHVPQLLLITRGSQQAAAQPGDGRRYIKRHSKDTFHLTVTPTMANVGSALTSPAPARVRWSSLLSLLNTTTGVVKQCDFLLRSRFSFFLSRFSFFLSRLSSFLSRF